MALVALLSGLLVGCGTIPRTSSLPLPPHVPGDLAVLLRVPGPVTMQVSGVALTQRGRSGLVYHLSTPTDDATLPVVLRTLRADPQIAAADVDLLIPERQRVVMLNDPQAPSEYWIDMINLRPVWEKGAFGAGVSIGIADDGINPDAPDLAGRILPGYNPRFRSTDTRDVEGHGTAVAQIAAGAGNDGVGVAGVAWQAKVVPVVIFEPDELELAYQYAGSEIADGLLWLANQGVRVINVSAGSAYDNGVIRAAFAQIVQRGILVVAATGDDPDESGYPGQYPGVLAIGASDSSNQPTDFTSRKDRIDLAAPGTSIPVFVPVNTILPVSSNGVDVVDGTSFAAPMVSGVAALLFGSFPELNAAAVADILRQSASHKGDKALGAGILDAGAAFKLAEQRVGHPPKNAP